MSSPTLKVELHSGQNEVYADKHRFKVIAAGRRWGKSRLAAVILLSKALQSPVKDVWYVAPTFQQARDIMWHVLLELGHEVIKSVNVTTSTITLINDRNIMLKGSDRPDTMRGVGLYYVVIDEYADMKSNVWEQILRPALADVKGGAMFIGTPKGRNHFWSLFKQGRGKEKDAEWKSWHFVSKTNPFLDSDEIDAAKRTLSTASFRQEFEASFEQGGSDLFKREWIRYSEEEPEDGEWYVAVDLAGFAGIEHASMQKHSRLDEHAIVIAKVGPQGWWIKDIRHGRWDVRRASVEILKAARDVDARVIGIEKGALRNAVLPYLDDQRRRIGFYPEVISLTHGGKSKTDRVLWSLQGRLEHGRIKFNTGAWNNALEEQLIHFPSKYVHDDLVDALSYIDQMGSTVYLDMDDFNKRQPNWEPIDAEAGY